MNFKYFSFFKLIDEYKVSLTVIDIIFHSKVDDIIVLKKIDKWKWKSGVDLLTSSHLLLDHCYFHLLCFPNLSSLASLSTYQFSPSILHFHNPLFPLPYPSHSLHKFHSQIINSTFKFQNHKTHTTMD